MDGGSQTVLAFSTFLQLESAARRAPTVEALRFTIVNELRRLIVYRQAALAIGPAAAMRVEAISGVAVLESDTPLVVWLSRVAARIAAGAEGGTLHPVDPHQLPARERDDWGQWSAPYALWCPLKTRDGSLIGALWLARDQPWPDNDRVMVERLAECYAHAWLALVGPRSRRRGLAIRFGAVAVIAGLMATLALPVSQSALAPAEVVASDPVAVSAPLDGVIARFEVQPNQPVKAGQTLFGFDDTTLKSQAAVAERSLAIADAELRQTTQGAMIDRKAAGVVAQLEAQVRLRRAELDYARSLLARVVVTAERDGVAVFTDANDWIGRPVATGQRILQIADPAHTELRVHLPIRDAIALEPGAAIDLFLDVAPLAPLPAILTRASYEAEMTPAGVLAYRVNADFTPGTPPPRIGLQGTAKVYGERVPLGLYLFRRPLAALRQSVGF